MHTHLAQGLEVIKEEIWPVWLLLHANNVRQQMAGRHSVLSKMAIGHFVHAEWSLKCGPVQVSMSIFGPCQMVSGRIEYQGLCLMD